MSSSDDDGDWESDSAVSSESDMGSSPDLEGRPVNEWFLDSKGLTKYKDEDKGYLGALPEHSTPCSFEFLQCMIHDLVLIVTSHCAQRSNFVSRESKTVSRTICKEIKRLRNNPELFPSGEVGEQFFYLVEEYCEWLETVLAHFAKTRNSWDKLLEGEIALVKAASWPTFQPGRNDWHQFLHNGAPGHRVIPKQASNTESMQIIPPGGLNMLQAWQTEIEDIMRTFDDHLRILRIPSHVVGDKRTYLAVTGNVRVMGTFADANGAPINVPETSSFLRDNTTRSTMPLTHLSQDLEAVDGRVGYSSQGTNYVCVREGRGSQGKTKAERNPSMRQHMKK